jgi:hypothetical protein
VLVQDLEVPAGCGFDTFTPIDNPTLSGANRFAFRVVWTNCVASNPRVPYIMFMELRSGRWEAMKRGGGPRTPVHSIAALSAREVVVGSTGKIQLYYRNTDGVWNETKIAKIPGQYSPILTVAVRNDNTAACTAAIGNRSVAYVSAILYVVSVTWKPKPPVTFTFVITAPLHSSATPVSPGSVLACFTMASAMSCIVVASSSKDKSKKELKISFALLSKTMISSLMRKPSPDAD